MKQLILTTAIIFSITTVFAQMNFKKSLVDHTAKEEVELVIVRNAEECLGYESSIYELINGKEHKVAVLYHDADDSSVASNLYNLNTIREVLTDFNDDGYHIVASHGENMDGRCNRKLKYTLQRKADYRAER